jgi:hypothetical protein
VARGWDSKSVESQIEAAERRRSPGKSAKTAEQLRREQQRSSIQLSRTRVLHDLEQATHQRHREMLEAALKHLDEQLAALDTPEETH